MEEYRNEPPTKSPHLSRHKGQSSKRQVQPRKTVARKESQTDILLKQLIQEMRDFRGDIQLIPPVKHTTCYKDSRCCFSIETTHEFHFILQNILSIMNKTGVAYKP